MSGGLDELRSKLHACLEATAELPVRSAASRRLGEASAVAADIARGDAPPEAVAKRVGQVEMLLEEIDDTGNPEADEYVEAARDLVAAIERCPEVRDARRD